jgi:uncharacterized protein (TIGR04255 family)
VAQIEPLPKFNNPPVVETVLGVFFRPLEGFTVAHQGALWEKHFRQRFPRVEERSPIDEVREDFGNDMRIGSVLTWQLSDRPPAPRLWAASDDNCQVLQIQRNALLANWLKTDDKANYRPYGTRRENFERDLEAVDAYLASEGMGHIAPTSWLVTYINHLECDGPPQLFDLLDSMFVVWRYGTNDDWLPNPDKLNLQLAFPFPTQRGRLNVQITPGIQRRDSRYLLKLELTARGTVKKEGLSAAMDCLDVGHEWVVRGFASLTSQQAHQKWGRTQ